MIKPSGGFEATTRISIKGRAEFTGVRHHIDGPPTAGLAVTGPDGIRVDVEFDNPSEADRFAESARVLADQLRIARERAEIAREPHTPTPTSSGSPQ